MPRISSYDTQTARFIGLLNYRVIQANRDHKTTNRGLVVLTETIAPWYLLRVSVLGEIDESVIDCRVQTVDDYIRISGKTDFTASQHQTEFKGLFKDCQ